MTELELLRAALKPFADTIARWETRPGHINTADDRWVLGDVDYLTVGDVRRAAEAVRTHGATGPAQAGQKPHGPSHT